jgi:hypothetical protein
LEDKIIKFTTHSKNKHIRDLYHAINEFKKGNHPKNNVAKDKNGDLLAAFHTILNRWKNYFSELLNVHRVSDVGQMDIHTTYMSIVTLRLKLQFKRHKSRGTDQTLAKLI